MGEKDEGAHRSIVDVEPFLIMTGNLSGFLSACKKQFLTICHAHETFFTFIFGDDDARFVCSNNVFYTHFCLVVAKKMEVSR